MCQKQQRMHAFTEIENKMEMAKTEKEPRSRNWERSHGITEEFKQHQLNRVSTRNLLVFVNWGQDGDDRERQSRRGEDVNSHLDCISDNLTVYCSEAASAVKIVKPDFSIPRNNKKKLPSSVRKHNCGGVAESVLAVNEEEEVCPDPIS